MLSPRHYSRLKEIPLVLRARAEYLASVLGSSKLEPNTNPQTSKEQPWLVDKAGRLARTQLFFYRTELSKVRGEAVMVHYLNPRESRQREGAQR